MRWVYLFPSINTRVTFSFPYYCLLSPALRRLLQSPICKRPYRRIASPKSYREGLLGHLRTTIANTVHMDIEHHFRAVEKEAQTDQDPLANTTTSGCFNCNICLDSAQDPIVTLCGHLYCWACLYKWMNHKEDSPQQCPVCKGALSLNTLVPLYGRGDTPKNSQSKGFSTTNSAIPQRPSAHRVDAPATLPQQQDSPQQLHLQYQYPQDPFYRNHVMESSPPSNFGGSPPRVPHPTSGSFGGMVISMLPWVFGNSEPGLYYSNAYYQMGIANNPRVRRQDMKTERSLNRISAFLFCCLVMCLLLF